jgi:hypothetical protein
MKRMLAALFRLHARQAILMDEKLKFLCEQRRRPLLTGRSGSNNYNSITLKRAIFRLFTRGSALTQQSRVVEENVL